MCSHSKKKVDVPASLSETETAVMETWLDKQYIETVLRSNNPGITVKQITVKDAVGKGENYGSTLYRVTVDYTTDSINKKRVLIVKCMPKTKMMQNILNSCSIFERESKMYVETLPRLQAILNGLDRPDPLTAEAFKTEREQTIIMEDLNEKGFKMADRQEGLNYDKCCSVMVALAKLHAASFIYYHQNPGLRKEYVDTLFVEKNRAMLTAIYTPMLTALQTEIKTWAGYERFADKLLAAMTVGNIIEVVSGFDSTETVTLIHGDPWTNNFLFKKCGCEATLVAVVDLQEVRLCSPCLDLQYFIYTSPSSHVRYNHMNEMLLVYYTEFMEIVTRGGAVATIGDDFTSFDNFKKKLDEKGVFGLKAACITLPVFLATAHESPDLDMAFKPEESELDKTKVAPKSDMGRAHSSPLFKKEFKLMLLHFERKGVL